MITNRTCVVSELTMLVLFTPGAMAKRSAGMSFPWRNVRVPCPR